jgi:carboxypeptidase family protein/TonB-dependent receptor-like protein
LATWIQCPIAALVGVLALSTLVHAQATTATLGGTVVDESDAIVPETYITVVNLATGLRRTTTAGAQGTFVVPLLPPGRYRLTAQRGGFAPTEIGELVLNVGDDLNVKLMLKVAGVGTDVIVTAEPPRVSTSPAVGTVVDRTFVENLPLNGRSFQSLITMTPGVVVMPTAFDDQGQFSVNGQRADANYFTVDGVSANFGVTGYFPMAQSASGALPALSAFGGTNSLVSIEAMQEFRIQTSSFAPEFGRTPGGQISIVTRSGGDAFHGTFFEYFRTDALDATDWFVKANGLPIPEERLNDFGSVLGGPVRKDRTFFFFSYEGLRLQQPSSVQTAVPNDASRQQAPSAIRPFLNAYPRANGADLGSGVAQFNASYANPSTLDAWSLRLDHVVNPRLTVFGRYNYSPSSFDQRGGIFSTKVLSTTSAELSSVHTLTLGLTHLIAQSMSHEVRVNYSSQRLSNSYAMDNFGGAVPLADAVLFPPGYSSQDSAFLFLITGAGEYAQGKFATDEQRQVNVLDNLSVVRGGHQLKFGMDYRWLAPFSSPFAYRQFVQFSGVTSNPGGALSGTASFVQPAAFQANALRSQNFSLYGQDTWSITHRLTATYGLRWDVNPPLNGKDSANEPFTVLGLENPATMTLAPRGTPLYETTYGNVAPRFGLAYQLGERPNWDTVLRGSVGVFYDLGQGSLGGVTSYFPYAATRIIQPSPSPYPLSPQDAAPPVFTVNPPVNTVVVADPHLKLPRSYQWNVALEQSLGSGQSVSVTYLGATGRDLLRVTQLFNVNPNFQSVALTDNSATSDYHALQLKFQRRLSRGLQAMTSYTWSHSTDDASTDAFATYLNTPGASEAMSDRGDSDFDIRHAFTAGVTYLLPSSASSQTVRALTGGWSLDALVYARSAPPVDVVGATNFTAGIALKSRPNVVPGVPLELYGDQYPGGKIFNPAAFVASPAGQQGNLGRNVLRGFGASQIDLAVQRQFHLTEKVALRFRVECFNLFNQTNFGSPTFDLSSPLFGRSTQTLANSLGSGGANGGYSPLYQIGGPRSTQLALRLEF